MHHNQPFQLARAIVEEGHPVRDVSGRGQPEQARAIPNLQPLAEQFGRILDVTRRGLHGRIHQQRLHEIPIRPIHPFHRQTSTPVVRLVGKVQPVEPITRVVAIPIQRFGAQHVHARMEEGHTLSQAHHTQAHLLDANAVGHRRRHRRRGIGVDVEQRLVVVLADIGDDLLRVFGVARRLAVVVHLRTRHDCARAIHQLVIG